VMEFGHYCVAHIHGCITCVRKMQDKCFLCCDTLVKTVVVMYRRRRYVGMLFSDIVDVEVQVIKMSD